LPLGIGLILVLLPFGAAGVGLVLGLAGTVVGCSMGEFAAPAGPDGGSRRW
jgi:hypothetical protein